MSYKTHVSHANILHIDGDSFFASVEQAQNPELRGLPIVTGAERGIVSSMSKEAKALGITRATPIHEIKKKFPNVRVVPGDYETYSIYSIRMYAIVRRYTNVVEEYSIDECFADLSGLRSVHRMSYEDIARKIWQELENELGITFSVGLASTKTLAKVASKWNKPHGFTIIEPAKISTFLKTLPVSAIWGVGAQSTKLLYHYSVYSALDFMKMSESSVSILHKPLRDTQLELTGTPVFSVVNGGSKAPQSISRTRTFLPASDEFSYILSELSRNLEAACTKARTHLVSPRRLYIYIKKHDFTYATTEVTIPLFCNNPVTLTPYLEGSLSTIYEAKTFYRATGVILADLQDSTTIQMDLFGEVNNLSLKNSLFTRVDSLNKKHGSHTVHIGSSHRALVKKENHTGNSTTRTHANLHPISRKGAISVPFLGYVTI